MNVFLSSALRRYVDGYDPQTGVPFQTQGGLTVAEVCQAIGVPVEEVKIVMVDGRSGSLSQVLQGHERLGLFPPVGGG